MTGLLLSLLLLGAPIDTPATGVDAARARLAAGDRAGAHALFEEAAAACEMSGDALCAARAYDALGTMARQDAAWRDVSAWFGKAAVAYERAGRVREQALAVRAMAYDASMPVDDRLAAVARAARIAEGLDDPEVDGLIRHLRGDMEFVAGRFMESQRDLEAALALLERADNQAAIARVLTSLGRAFRLHGRPDRALEQYKRAFVIQQRLGDLEGQSQSMNAIAIAHRSLGDLARAVPASERALAIARRSGAPGVVLIRTGDLAATYSVARRYAQARVLLQDTIRRRLQAGAGEAIDDLYLALADVNLGLGRNTEALDAATTGIELAQKRGQPEFLVWGHDVRARSLERLGRIDEALADAERAVQGLESLRSTLVPEDALKVGFGETNHAIYATLIRLLSKDDRPAEALVVAERGRARAFLDLLATRSLPADSTRGDALIARFRDPKEPSLRSFVAADPPTFVTLTETARRLGSHVVSYWVDEDAITIWVLAPDGRVNSRRVAMRTARLQHLVSETTRLDGAAGAVRGDAGVGHIDVSGNSRDAFRALYDVLVAPVRQWLPARGDARLTIVPHGPLFRLSYAALTNPRGQYLIEGYSLHYAPSVAVMQMTERQTHSTGARDYVLIADPGSTPRVDGHSLAPLPAARREVARVAAIVGSAEVVQLTGGAASEEMVRAAVSSRAVVHLATHGIVHDDRPFDAFLALGATGKQPAADGLLTTREIYDLSLKAQLVVLSGCGTGRGKVTGDGVLGLTRAFLYAGTPSLVATLWDVYDDAGAQILPPFYRAWLDTGDKAAAMRRSQIAAIRDLRAGRVRVATSAGEFVVAEHPAFWAGFVLVGEP